MLDDKFIADTVRRTNAIALKNPARWNTHFSGFLERHQEARAELRDWEARVEAHRKRVREEPQLRWMQRPPEATAGWQTINYSDPSTRYMVCPWPRNPKFIVVDDHIVASVYPKTIEPCEYDIIWDAYGWTPPELLPEAKPVIPVMPLDPDAQYQESDLDGMVFGLTCFHDAHGPSSSANIRPINPWVFGIGSGRGFTEDKEDDERSMAFLIKMRRAASLEDWQVEGIKKALEGVEHEFLGFAAAKYGKPPQVGQSGFKSSSGSIAWSGPMTKAEMARRLTRKPTARSREVAALLDRIGLEHVEGRRYRIRIDEMDPATRKKLDGPV